MGHEHCYHSRAGNDNNTHYLNTGQVFTASKNTFRVAPKNQNNKPLTMATKKEPDMAHMKSKGATASAGGDGEGHSVGLPHGGTGRGHTGSQCRQRRQRMKCAALTPCRILHRPFEVLFLLKCNHSGAVSAGSALMLLRNTGNCCSIVQVFFREVLGYAHL
jgi:hypothetical protein